MDEVLEKDHELQRKEQKLEVGKEAVEYEPLNPMTELQDLIITAA